MPDRTGYLKPEVVARLKGIDLRARLVVEGFLAGLHRSPYKGFSVEFCEHRQYMPGDELKRVDWKVYARTDRFYVREYEEETNLRAYLIVDISGSMAYRSSQISKLDYAGCLAASLAYLLLHQKDSAGLVLFSDRIQTYVPPRSTPHHLHVLLHELAGIRPGGDTDIAGTLHQLAERIRRRGLVIILSDLWDDQNAILTALRHFRHRRHEVLVFHILDRNERDFDFRSTVQLRDLETGKTVTVDPRVVGAEYRHRFRETITQLEHGCREGLIDYNRVFTDTPFEQALFSYLCRRSRLH
ncbi:MAG: DUF58 domain-containing protein [candidate division WOR-3 bacterium]